MGPWKQLATEFRGVALGPLFASKKPREILELVERAKATDPTYRAPNLLSYFALTIPADVDPQAVANALSAWPSVEVAYVEPPPVEPPVVNAADDPLSGNQGYLNAAPDGIDARYAWGFPGGDGTGQALVDMEYGWTFNHEDLAALGITLISGISYAYFEHGTAVLGEVAAQDNTVGCVGIAPKAAVRCVGQYSAGGIYTGVSQPILNAIAVMKFGDVLLLEAQAVFGGYTNVPVEIEPAVFDVVRLGTALGIVVVEAAANGGLDLDTVAVGGKKIFNRASADFKDSGAIIVGAALSMTPHGPSVFSCYGSRIDCYGWGDSIQTLTTNAAGTATDQYTGFFAGTSGASPIIAGAALALQGLAAAPVSLGHRFAPWHVRAILSDPANGTPSANPAADRIGVMPNLRAIIDGQVLNLAPDVYVRDFVGDTGDPHAGAINASPDVILRQTEVVNPQTSFGEGSGTENTATLGSPAEQGQNNFIYVRVRNRGGTAAANVDATVYWAPASTLVTPNLWTLVGSTTIASVPTGNLLTVSNAIVWPTVPAPGHYCFVALIGNAKDPAPAPAAFLNWANYQLFIRANNNVTWCNFNVVNIVPPPSANPSNYVPLPFLAAGAPDIARRMRLEVAGGLPRGAQALLEMPRDFAELLRAPGVRVKGARNRRVVHVPVNSWGRTTFAEVAFPANATIPMRLLVHVPKALRKHEFEIFVRQLWENQEVGRVTWRLAPRRNTA